MTEPTIIWPNCKTEIRLTESLAAPLIAATRKQFEQQPSQKDEEIAKRELELTVEKRVQEGLGDVREQAKCEAEKELKLKVMEKDQTIASMQQTIEELKQKAEQGSQQLQGKVQELELENLLGSKYPFDSIEPVPKGEFGGDVLQRVVSQSSQQAGTILWECKRTKIGATAGSSSSARTSVLPKPRFPSSSARCFPKASKPSMSLTAYG
jgi:hypothetical protein